MPYEVRHGGSETLYQQVFKTAKDDEKRFVEEEGLKGFLRGMLDPKYRSQHPYLQRTMTKSGASAALGDLMLASVVDAFAERSAALRAGATLQVLTEPAANYHLTKVSSIPTMEWLAEGTTETDSQDVTLTQSTLTMYTCRGKTKWSLELDQDGIGFYDMLETAIMQSFLYAFDDAVINGSTLANRPTGLLKDKNLPAVAYQTYPYERVDLVLASTSGSELTAFFFQNIGPYFGLQCGIDHLMTQYNVPYESMNAAVMRPEVWGVFKAYRNENGVPPSVGEPFDKMKFIPCNKMDRSTDYPFFDSVLLGNWNEYIIGMRQELRLDLMRETYLPNGQFALHGTMRMNSMMRSNSMVRICNIKPIEHVTIDISTYIST